METARVQLPKEHVSMLTVRDVTERTQRTALLREMLRMDSRELQRREDHLRDTSNHIRRVVGELNDLLHRADRTLAEGRREQRAAETTTDRLAAQSQRARRIADAAAFSVGTDRSGGRAGSQKPIAKSDVKAVPQAIPANSGRNRTNGASSGAQAAGPERMKQMLQNTRDSLSELRSIVHGGSAQSRRGHEGNGKTVAKDKSEVLGRVARSATTKSGNADRVITTERSKTP